MKVIKVSLIDMIGDINFAKLYVLRGSTFPSIAATSTSDELSKINPCHEHWPYE
jgi:hypothetical protein